MKKLITILTLVFVSGFAYGQSQIDTKPVQDERYVVKKSIKKQQEAKLIAEKKRRQEKKAIEAKALENKQGTKLNEKKASVIVSKNLGFRKSSKVVKANPKKQ